MAVTSLLTSPPKAGRIVLSGQLDRGYLRRASRPLTVPAWHYPALLVLLPMFSQSFQYMVDLPALYFLSKAWPFLMLPFFVWALGRLDIPWKLLQIITLLWILAVTPLVGIVQLGNGFFAALATTVKVLSYTYTFSMAGLFVLLRFRMVTVGRVLLGLGIGTYAIMLLLWITVPYSAYGGGDIATKLFMYDPERGYHLYMPMFFGTLLIFYLNRSFWLERKVWKLIAVAVAFTLQLWIYKERAAIAGGLATVLITTIWSSGPRWRPALLAVLALSLGVLGLLMLQRLENASELPASLGGSLAVRRVSIATAWNYISTDPARWLIGNGATTRFGNITFAQIFGNRMFFLTDIGWFGVIFEYGVVGAILLLLVHVAGLRCTAHWADPRDPLSHAFLDYIVYLLMVSVIYSVVFTPGELTSIIALSFLFHCATVAKAPPYGIASSQPSSAMPRQAALVSSRPSGRFRLPKPAGLASKG